MTKAFAVFVDNKLKLPFKMKTYNYSALSSSDIANLVQRNVDPANEIRAIVEEVLASVKLNGDTALIDYNQSTPCRRSV